MMQTCPAESSVGDIEHVRSSEAQNLGVAPSKKTSLKETDPVAWRIKQDAFNDKHKERRRRERGKRIEESVAGTSDEIEHVRLSEPENPGVAPTKNKSLKETDPVAWKKRQDAFNEKQKERRRREKDKCIEESVAGTPDDIEHVRLSAAETPGGGTNKEDIVEGD